MKIKTAKNNIIEYKYTNIISMIFLTIMLGTYLLAYKMVPIGGFIESAGIFIFPFNYAITDITTEVYGYEQTKKMIKNVFICCLMFAIVIPLIALLPAPENWNHQEGYTYVLGNVFRFFVANSLGIVIGISINSILISRWRVVLQGKHFWLRSIGASAIGELITSIIADIIAFAGTTNFIDLIKLMVAIYFVKFVYAVILAWPNTLIATYLKLKEGLVLRQSGINFNPFLSSGNSQGHTHAFNT